MGSAFFAWSGGRVFPENNSGEDNSSVSLPASYRRTDPLGGAESPAKTRTARDEMLEPSIIVPHSAERCPTIVQRNGWRQKSLPLTEQGEAFQLVWLQTALPTSSGSSSRRGTTEAGRAGA